MLTGFLKPVRRLVIAELIGPGLQYFKCALGVQVCLSPWEGFELVVGRHHPFIPINLAYGAFLIRPNLWEEARSMKFEM